MDIPLDLSRRKEEIYFEDNIDCLDLTIGENKIQNENIESNISLQFQPLDKLNELPGTSSSQSISLDPEVINSENEIHIETNNSMSTEINSENEIHIETNNSMSAERKEINSSRKRKRFPESWKVNQIKVACNSGQEYMTKKGKLMPARKMGSGCDEICKLRCHQRISEESRHEIFDTCWKISNHMNQWQYINKHVQNRTPVQRTTDAEDPRRQSTNDYFFTINGEIVKVCQTMFVQTLGISKTTVHTAIRKYIDNSYISSDGRGKSSAKKNRSETEKKKQNIRDHINKFPIVESHYSRERSKRQYLEQGLSVRHMHRLYKAWMEDEKNDEEIASEHYYRKVFVSEFILGFFIPKKDQCDRCSIYNSANATEKESLKEDYDNHLRDKKIVRELKESDKKASVEKIH